MEQPVPQVPSTNKSLPSIGKLFKDSISLYRASWKSLILAILVPIVALILGEGLIIALILLISGGDITSNVALVIPPAIVGLAYLLLINAVGKIILIRTIEKQGQVNIRELISQSFPLTGRFIWLQLLIGLATLVGFVLLIIPGIILTIWFLFASFILVVEGKGGMDAMKQSRAYVKGRFWGILVRMLVLIVIVAAISSISSISENQALITFFQLISSFVIAPIATIYSFKLYQGAKA